MLYERDELPLLFSAVDWCVDHSSICLRIRRRIKTRLLLYTAEPTWLNEEGKRFKTADFSNGINQTSPS